MRVTSARTSRSTLYGQVSTWSSVVFLKNSTMVSTAIRLATSPEACPPMPSATMASRSSTGRCRLSSLWVRFMPTWVSPENRTRIPSSGNDELIAGDYTLRHDELDGRPGLQDQALRRLVRVAVDDVAPFLVGLDLHAGGHRRDRLVAAHRLGEPDARQLHDQRERRAVDAEEREAVRPLHAAIEGREAQADLGHRRSRQGGEVRARPALAIHRDLGV